MVYLWSYFIAGFNTKLNDTYLILIFSYHFTGIIEFKIVKLLTHFYMYLFQLNKIYSWTNKERDEENGEYSYF
jgi:hypothetical protein